MSIIFAGTSLSDFSLAGNFSLTTTAANIGPYVNEGVVFTTSADIIAKLNAVFAPQSEAWISFYYLGTNVGNGTGPAGGVFEIAASETGTALFALYSAPTNTNLLRFMYWNGSAFVVIAQTLSLSSSTRYKIDIHLKMHNTDGLIRVYVNTALVLEMIGDTIFTADTTFNTLRMLLAAAQGSGLATFSAVIVSTQDTRDFVFDQNQFSGDGAQTAWAGAFADVTKTGKSDLTYIASDTADQVETFLQADIHTDLASLVPAAVVIPVRCRKGDTGPQNIQGVARIGGTDFMTANLDPTSGFTMIPAVFDENPDTAAPWTVAEVNAAEFGVKSIT